MSAMASDLPACFTKLTALIHSLRDLTCIGPVLGVACVRVEVQVFGRRRALEGLSVEYG